MGWGGDDYRSLVPQSCTRLLGLQAALTRPEFQQMRDMPRTGAQSKTLKALVSMGGTDAENITQSVLEVMLDHPTAKNHRITVAMGETAPWTAQIQAFVAKLPNISLRINERDMAHLLSKTDYVNGAAGVSAYERFAMSIPTILSTVAENQIKGARTMAQSGAVEFIGDVRDPLWSGELKAGLDKVQHPQFRQLMSTQARQVCDGLGAYRVIANLCSDDVFCDR